MKITLDFYQPISIIIDTLYQLLPKATVVTSVTKVVINMSCKVHVIFVLILTKHDFYDQILVKLPNIKFNESPSSGNGV